MKDELKKINAEIKSPEERAANWKDFIIAMAQTEETILIDVLSINSPEYIEEYDTKLMLSVNDTIANLKQKQKEIDAELEPYISALKSVVERLEKTSKYVEFCHQYLYENYHLEQAYKKAVTETEENIKKWVLEDLRKAATEMVTDKKKFLDDKKWMITPILFQPPMITSEHAWKRELINKVFSKWEPNRFVLMYCNALNKAFEKF